MDLVSLLFKVSQGVCLGTLLKGCVSTFHHHTALKTKHNSRTEPWDDVGSPVQQQHLPSWAQRGPWWPHNTGCHVDMRQSLPGKP